VFALPLHDLFQPMIPNRTRSDRSRSPDEGHESVETGDDVSEDGDLSLHNLVHVLGLNVEVSDTSMT